MKILSKFLKYVSLNVAGMIGISCYILADTFFVANALGSEGLAALNLSISVYSMINAVGLMLGIGGATKYAILKSQNHNKEADCIFSGTVLFGTGSGLLALFMGIFLSVPLAKLLGADSSTFIMTVTYLRVILCFSPCFILNNILIAFVRNDGDPQLSMIAMITGSLANIILDYLFMFPFSMGMFGAAFATGIAPVISIGILLLHFLRKKARFHFSWYQMNLKQSLSILPLGLSSFITEISSGIVLIVFNLEILKLTGNIGVAAYGIVANLSLVCIAVFTGIAQGLQPLTSQAYGKEEIETLGRLKKYSIILALSLSVLIYLLVNLLSDNIITLFNKEGNLELTEIAKNGLRVYFTGFVFAGINIVTAAFLSASSRPGTGFWISITRGCLAIVPLVMILPKLFGMNGIWLSFTFAEVITLCICLSLRAIAK